MSQSLIDTHAHLLYGGIKNDLEGVVSRARDSQVTHIVNISLGPDIGKMKESLEKTSAYDFIYHAVGVHPDDAQIAGDGFFKDFESLLKIKKVVAIGETGLDFYRSKENAEKQKDCFRKFIGIAKSFKLPLVIHQRGAFREVIDILKEENASNAVACVFHCFGGSWQEAKEILDIGGHISLTGIVTFKKAGELREVAAKIPLERIMLETDSPFLAPEPKRGETNEPAYIIHIAKKLSEIKNIALEETAARTSLNAKGFFRLE